MKLLEEEKNSQSDIVKHLSNNIEDLRNQIIQLHDSLETKKVELPVLPQLPVPPVLPVLPVPPPNIPAIPENEVLGIHVPDLWTTKKFENVPPHNPYLSNVFDLAKYKGNPVSK